MAWEVISGFFENRLSEGCFLVIRRLMKTNLFPSEASDSGSKASGSTCHVLLRGRGGGAKVKFHLDPRWKNGEGVMHNTPGNKKSIWVRAKRG